MLERMGSGSRAGLMPDHMSILTRRQRAFVHNYVRTKKATPSARLAGYSDRHASTAGRALLARDAICRAIDIEQKRIMAAEGVTKERIISELACIAFYDPRKLFDDFGNPKRLKDLDASTAAAVKDFDVDPMGNPRVKTHNKIDALVKLGEELGLFRKTLNINGPGSGANMSELTDAQLLEIISGQRMIDVTPGGEDGVPSESESDLA